MRVLAIDPGYDRIGIAVMETVQGQDTVLFSQCLETSRTDDFHDRLLSVGKTVASVLKTYTPDCLAIETLFFNKNVKTALGVAEARGVILYVSRQAGCRIYEFSPQAIKIATTGYGNSDKTAVFSMVQRLVTGVPKTALDDEYDAIAVGVTCLAQYGRAR